MFTSNTPENIREMLAKIGVEKVEDLFAAIPADVRYPALQLPPALTEGALTCRSWRAKINLCLILSAPGARSILSRPP